MPPKAKENIGLIGIGAVCGAILTVLTLMTRVDGYMEQKIRRIAKDQIRLENQCFYDKINVLYLVRKNEAERDSIVKEAWNKAVDQVKSQRENTLEVIK